MVVRRATAADLVTTTATAEAARQTCGREAPLCKIASSLLPVEVVLGATLFTAARVAVELAAVKEAVAAGGTHADQATVSVTAEAAAHRARVVKVVVVGLITDLGTVSTASTASSAKAAPEAVASTTALAAEVVPADITAAAVAAPECSAPVLLAQAGVAEADLHT
jgi:hypothetical protein